ncbi:MAG: GTPase [Cystobacter sp.]
MEFNVAEEVRRQLEEALRKRGRVNIVIAGRSGVGKSTLINAVFQGQLAETGQGRPVTRSAREYTKEGIPVALLDTRGLEMAQYAETVQQLEQEVQSRAKDPDARNHLHIAWVCVSEDSRRVEPGESAMAEMLARYMPVVALITKARADGGFRDEVLRLLPMARNVVRVRALRERDDEGHVLEPRGLVELIDLTMQLVPESQRDALAAAQKVSVAQKQTRARLIVAGAASSAALAAISPIPFSDALVLVPIQIGMLAGVSTTFGLSTTQVFLTTLISAAGGGFMATVSGRAIVVGLLKFVPGLGTAAGALISGTTAASITTLFGEAYVAVLTRLFERDRDRAPSEEEIVEAFREELHRPRSTH